MPLTHVHPGQDAHAIHAAELFAAAQSYADATLEYLQRVFWGLAYPRTVWRAGVGQSATSTSVTAALDAGGDAIDQPASDYTTGSGPTTSTGVVSGKAVFGAINTLKAAPHQNQASQFSRFYDGLVVKRLPATLAPPPPVLEPAEPSVAPLSHDGLAQYAAVWGRYGAYTIRWYLARRWREEWWPVTRSWWGTGQSVDTQAKTATVLLEPFPNDAEQVTETFGWGWRTWSAGQLAGKRVRVAIDPLIGRWVDDLA